MTIIVKNTTNESITFQELSGFSIAANSQETISDYFQNYQLSSAATFLDVIINEDVIINDGENDLTATDAIILLQGITLDQWSGSQDPGHKHSEFYSSIGNKVGGVGEDGVLIMDTDIHIKEMPYDWPASQIKGYLYNDGTGDLNWISGIRTISGEDKPIDPDPGDMWFNPEDGTMYYFHGTHQCWFSTNRNSVAYSNNSSTRNMYLKPTGDITNAKSGYYYFGRTISVVSISGYCVSAHTSNAPFEIRNDGSIISTKSWTANQLGYASYNLNIEMNAGAVIQIYIGNVTIDRPLMTMEVAWRIAK